MSFTLNTDGLVRGIDRVHDRTLQGFRTGFKEASRLATLEMRGTTRHGDQTGATRASYVAFVVGQFDSGRREAQSSYAEVESRNPGRAGRSSITIIEPLAIVFMSGTDYQRELETQGSGRSAVIGPVVQRYASIAMRLGAEGAKRALS